MCCYSALLVAWQVCCWQSPWSHQGSLLGSCMPMPTAITLTTTSAKSQPVNWLPSTIMRTLKFLRTSKCSTLTMPVARFMPCRQSFR